MAPVETPAPAVILGFVERSEGSSFTVFEGDTNEL